MTENPLKLFSTRAERYPEPTDADIAQGAAGAALAAIPFVGGPLVEVLAMALAPANDNLDCECDFTKTVAYGCSAENSAGFNPRQP